MSCSLKVTTSTFTCVGHDYIQLSGKYKQEMSTVRVHSCSHLIYRKRLLLPKFSLNFLDSNVIKKLCKTVIK